MRRLLVLFVAGAVALTNTGCFVNLYSSDPNRRMSELLVVSENLRQIQDEWERFWFMDQPSHLTYDRIDGSIQ